jgi:hypothetical protein
MYKSISTFLGLIFISYVTLGQNQMRTNVSTFDVIGLKTNGNYNGQDLKGGLWNGHHYFKNSYDTAWKVWSGIAVSNHTDTITDDYTNEYSSITGGGINGTKNYGVCFMNGTIISENSSLLSGFYISNTTYAYKTIKNGSAFSKKFGGSSGNDKDWFRVKILNYSKGKKTDSTLVYLADFQNDDNSKDYILNKWTWVDLSAFKITDSLTFTFESSDVGQFGINTPTYFAFDDFNAVAPTDLNMMPGLFFNESEFFTKGNKWDGEFDTTGGFAYGKLYFENNYNTQWKTFSGWAVSKNTDTSKSGFNAQFSNITAKGAGHRFGNDTAFAISYGRSVIRLPYKRGGWPITYFRFSYTNNTYTYKSMKYGDAFSKKFGGILGTDPDYLKLFVIGYDEYNKPVDTLGLEDMNDEMALADFRMNRRFISNNWVSYYSGGFKHNIVRMEFQLESTDNGQFGMNTPAYFCLDNIFEYPVESIDTKIQKAQLKIYPNPSSNAIYVDLHNVNSYEVLDLNGKQHIFTVSPDCNKIDISNLPAGVYCLKVLANEEYHMARFVKL